MKDDIATIRQALNATRTIAYAHQRGGLHKLWPQLVEALKALDRIEQHITTTQMPLFQTTPDTADYKRGT